MTQYWWVNQNQTAQHEIEGQYLWSPKTTRNGVRNQFYDNMRRADPGDLVLSFYDQAIHHIGRVVDFAFTAPKPEEFGEAGAYWNSVGWHLPVFWTALTPPVRPKPLIRLLAPYLPERYSPLDPATGNGRQNLYLAEIPEEVFSIIVGYSVYDESLLGRGGSNSLTYPILTEILDDITEQRILTEPGLDSTTRESLIQERRVQGKFRSNVQTVERACRLTGITNPALLIASHIKPWRLCEKSEERLDPMNGLMLTPDADLLFDRGFISFEDNGAVKVSPRVDRTDLRRLGFEELAWENYGFGEASAAWQSGSLASGQRAYMDFHRSQVFVA